MGKIFVTRDVVVADNDEHYAMTYKKFGPFECISSARQGMIEAIIAERESVRQSPYRTPLSEERLTRMLHFLIENPEEMEVIDNNLRFCIPKWMRK